MSKTAPERYGAKSSVALTSAASLASHNADLPAEQPPARGHGREDPDGTRRTNPSDRGESVHEKLQYLRQHVQSTRQERGLLDSRLTDRFGNTASWLKELIMESL